MLAFDPKIRPSSEEILNNPIVLEKEEMFKIHNEKQQEKAEAQE